MNDRSEIDAHGNMHAVLLVLSTWPTTVSVATLARKVIENRLAACVHCMPQIHSFFHWQGELKQESEQLLLFKTTSDRLSALQDFLGEAHPYELPEIIAIPVVAGLPAYLDWLRNSVS